MGCLQERRLLVCSVFLLFAGASCLSGDLATSITKADRAGLEQRLVNRLSSATPGDVFFLAAALNSVNDKTLKAHKDQLCTLAQRGFDSEDIESLASALQAAALLKCTLEDASSKTAVLVSELKGSNLAGVYAAAEGLRSLVIDFKSGLPSDLDLRAITAQLLVRQKYDGTFGREDEEEGSCVEAGYALHALAAIAAISPSVVDTQALGVIAEKAEDLSERLLESLEANSSLRVLTLTLRGLWRISEVTKEPFELPADALMQLAALASSMKRVSSAADVFFLLEAVSVLASVPKSKPLVVHAATPSVESSQQATLALRVSDLRDEAVAGAKLTITAVLRGGGVNKPLKGVGELSAVVGRDGQASIELPQLQAGQYVLEISVEAPEPYAQVKGARREVRVRGSVEVERLDLTVARRGRDAGEERRSARFPSAVTQRLHLDDSSILSLAFNCTPFVPQQTFVRFWRAGSPSPVFVGKPSSASSARVEVEVDLEDAAEEAFGLQSGEYELQVLLGDALMPAPIAWTAAYATVTFSRPPPSPADALQDMPYQPRAPQESAPEALALALTALVLLATVALLVTALSSAPFDDETPIGGGGAGAAIAMQGAVVCYYGVVLFFWFRLPFLQVLGAMSLLLPLLGFRVWRACSAHGPAPSKTA